MPTKKEAEDYQRMIEQKLLEIEESNLPARIKESILTNGKVLMRLYSDLEFHLKINQGSMNGYPLKNRRI